MRKKLSSYPRVLQVSLVTTIALRRMGFVPDELFLHIARNEKERLTVFVLLTTQGREFRVVIGPVEPFTPETLQEKWPQLVIEFNNEEFLEGEVKRIYEKEWARMGGTAGLMMALRGKGFEIPALKVPKPPAAAEPVSKKPRNNKYWN